MELLMIVEENDVDCFMKKIALEFSPTGRVPYVFN
jgi:hypothetical protein